MNINKLQRYAFGLAMLTSVTWADRADYDNARDLAIKAEAKFTKDGDGVLKSITDRKDGLFDTRTKHYVFVIDSNDKVIANGGNRASIGKDVNDIKTHDGRTLGDRIDDLRNHPEQQGWVGYSWEPADSDETLTKHSYLIYHKDRGLTFGSGAYESSDK